MTRTLGPHGDSTEVSFPGRGSMGTVHLFNEIPKKTTVVKDLPGSQMEPEDYGSGAQHRRANTTSIRISYIKLETIYKSREEVLEQLSSQAASFSGGPQTESVPENPLVSVQAVSANFPVVTTVGGVHAKMRTRQTKQQSNNEETSDAVACHKVKAAERTIGTIIKPAIKKTEYVKRNIVEFCCGENSKIGEQMPTRWLFSHQTYTRG